MKGIILAGGTGSRLYPLTRVGNKHLLPVYDKPIVYYPLTTLIENGIRELCLISTPQDLPRFRQLLGDGSGWGISIEYREQAKPEGIAQAFLIADSFIGDQPVALILGDNLFLGDSGISQSLGAFDGHGAVIHGSPVRDPERYGVVEMDAQGRPMSIQEKPRCPRSAWAVPGLYLFDGRVVETARRLKPSRRGELEITDVIDMYLRQGLLRVRRLPRGLQWWDVGTIVSLQEASAAVRAFERRRRVKAGCPELAAFQQGFISRRQFAVLTARMPACEYRSGLETIAAAVARCRTRTASTPTTRESFARGSGGYR